MAEPRPDPLDAFVPSILDRLIAPESAGSGPTLGFRLGQLIEGVRRDLEDLLNTRHSHHGLDPAFAELYASVFTYGLPDFGALDSTKERVRRQIGELVEDIINRHEPRLRDVRAFPAEVSAGDDRVPTVRLLIDARLRVEPYPDVGFESVIELASGQTSIRPRDDQR